MQKTILITGATDGIGLAAAGALLTRGQRVLVHGRNADKLAAAQRTLAGEGVVDTLLADLSRPAGVEALAAEVAARHERLDVLINNAGVFRAPEPVTADGLDVRFAVNTLAPCLLTRRLLPLLGDGARVINVASAAQAPVDARALAGETRLADDYAAYAQSKLALIAWSRALARELGEKGPVVVALNPGSLLATKMVREGFGVAGNDIAIGADILCRAALDDEFARASGEYFDNDAGRFAPPHPDALDPRKCAAVASAIDAVLARLAARQAPAGGRADRR